MPRTRHHLDRDAKRTEVLDAAEHQVLTGGYDGLSLAAIARQLGLSQNSIYWYFESKDALFVAVLERLLDRVVIPPHKDDLDVRAWILDVIDRLAGLQDVRASARQRARTSQLVADFETRLRAHLAELLMQGLAGAAPPDQLDIAIHAFMATANGVIDSTTNADERRQVLAYTLDHLFPQ